MVPVLPRKRGANWKFHPESPGESRQTHIRVYEAYPLPQAARFLDGETTSMRTAPRSALLG